MWKSNSSYKSAQGGEQDELRKLEEQFHLEDQQVIKCLERSASRPQTAASQKTAVQHEEIDEFDDENLDNSLAKVFELTGEKNVDILIERLVNTDDTQFGLFSSINLLEAEASNMETKICDAEQELKRAQRFGINSETKISRDLQSMAEQKKQLEEHRNGVELEYHTQLETWNQYQSTIMTVHTELGLSLPEDLVGTKDVTENNVFQYLAGIESAANAIIAAIQGDEDHESQGLSNNTIVSSFETKLELPSTTTASGEYHFELDSDDGERPLTMEELQESLRSTQSP